MKQINRTLSTIYFLTGFFVILAATWRIARLVGGWKILGGSLALAKRLITGIYNPEDLSAITNFLLPQLIAFFLGVVLILISADMKKSEPTLPKLGTVCNLLLILLIGVQVVEVIFLVRIDALVFAFLLAYILGFQVCYTKIHHHESSISNHRKKLFVIRVYQTALAILVLLLIANFVFSYWLNSQFPGYQIEYL
jgi:hypothetical protein